jgi:UDP-galactopyranose mutase
MIIKRNRNIILDFIPNTFIFEKYINSFKTIIHSLKQNIPIPITKLKLWSNKISVEQIIALANDLKINTTVKNSIIKSYE